MESMKIPCCPELLADNNCDTLTFNRTTNYMFVFKDTRINIQLIITFMLKRCTLGLALGDPVYTITLLPGEKVQLFSSDRRSSFTYDAATKLTYRNEQISEEQYWMRASQSYFSDLEMSQSGHDVKKDTDRWNFSGSANGSVSPWPWDPSVKAGTTASMNSDSSSTLDYLHRQGINMNAAASQAVNATHQAYSISLGEVATRTHVAGESQDHFEASSREFSNPNSCHAITYLFYRLNKKQVVSFDVVSIEKIILNEIPGVITPEVRAEIMRQLDAELIAAGILDKDGTPSEVLKGKVGFKSEFSLPTAGIIVKGCLDECNTCEPARRERIHLENEMLRKQVELLEKSQEYRCCPGVAKEDTDCPVN